MKASSTRPRDASRTVKKVQDLREPSKEERAQYEMTPLPYRSWCRCCVRGRGKQMPHQGGSQETLTSRSWVVKRRQWLSSWPRKERPIMCAAAPRKTSCTYIAKGVAGFLREVVCLHEEIVVKSDQDHIVEYAGVLLNRFEVGMDGRTAYERNKGKKATTLAIDIGGVIQWSASTTRIGSHCHCHDFETSCNAFLRTVKSLSP